MKDTMLSDNEKQEIATHNPKAKQEEIKSITKLKIFNMCILWFVFALNIIATITFFVALFNTSVESAYAIASIYILGMLLAVPTLKILVDKITCPITRIVNVVFMVWVFKMIMIFIAFIAFAYAYPAWF